MVSTKTKTKKHAAFRKKTLPMVPNWSYLTNHWEAGISFQGLRPVFLWNCFYHNQHRQRLCVHRLCIPTVLEFMGQCIYKCFVRLFLVFPVDQFDWLGEKNQQPYGGFAKTKTDTLANWCLEQRLSYWWSAQADQFVCPDSFFGTWMKDWNHPKLLRGQLLSWSLLLILLKREWSVYNRSISCMYYTYINHAY